MSTNFADAEVPPSNEHPEGMKEIESEDDTYLASYIPGIPYAKYGDKTLSLSMLMPARAKEGTPLPVIMYVQGSRWLEQDLYLHIPQLSDFANEGYVIASVEYRHSLVAKIPAQIQDVKAAIRFMRANANEYNIDPERIGIWGGSSGGHMAALVGTSEGVEEFMTEDNRCQSSSVKAVVDFYGPTIFTQMSKYPSAIDHDAEDSPESLVIGGPIQDPKYRKLVQQYNPIAYISEDKQLPPFLIVHGDKDPYVPFNQSVLLYNALRDAGQQVEFYKVKGAGHGVRFWTPKVLKIVHDFFNEYLR